MQVIPADREEASIEVVAADPEKYRRLIEEEARANAKAVATRRKKR